MNTFLRNCFLAGLLGLVTACSGGGGGDSAQGVDPGPPPPGGQVPPEPEVPTPSPSPYLEATELKAAITSARIGDDGRAVIKFQLADGSNVAITDVTEDDVRFVLAKLQGSTLGNLTGTWQSYVNGIEEAGSVGPGTERKLQAAYESSFGTFGELLNHGDGTYTYTYGTDVNALSEDILDQAEVEGLNLDYEPQRPHRVAIQFDNAPGKANPFYDWEPASGSTEGVFSMHIAATENCNQCHDPLAFHGGGRIEVEYCVTCHNAGTSDANSGNTVDMKVMIHKIHMGENLPSVQDGGEYAIWGYNDSKHDYSELSYPQDIRNCVNCHVGTGTDNGNERLTLTAQGDNWTEVPTRAACGSCHDNVNFERHAGGNEDDSRCLGCHSTGGPAGNVADSHIIASEAARENFAAEILSVTSTQPGQTPIASFRIYNPTTDQAYDILNDPVWTNAEASLSVKFGWDTRDYSNTGNGSDSASTISSDALADATPNGDGSFRVTAPQPIPNGLTPPGIAASGSGVALIEGRAGMELEEDDVFERVPLTNAHFFFPIQESDGTAVPRREAVALDNCLACHGTITFHGDNRNDNIQDCVSCHNPRYYSTRNERSVDFKVLAHALHADEETDYPGTLSNCVACHTEDGYTLPLADGVLGTTNDPGADLQDPRDDTVTTPTTAVCSSCHTGTTAMSHMTSNGGSFNTTQQAIDDGDVVEECAVCHAEGRSAAVSKSHGL